MATRTMRDTLLQTEITTQKEDHSVKTETIIIVRRMKKTTTETTTTTQTIPMEAENAVREWVREYHREATAAEVKETITPMATHKIGAETFNP